MCHLSELVVLARLRKVLQMTPLCRQLNIVLRILVKLCKPLLISSTFWIQPQVSVLFFIWIAVHILHYVSLLCELSLWKWREDVLQLYYVLGFSWPCLSVLLLENVALSYFRKWSLINFAGVKVILLLCIFQLYWLPLKPFKAEDMDLWQCEKILYSIF